MSAPPRSVTRRINRKGGPAHAQIEDRVAEAIGDGAIRPGDRLPPERELAERLGVSRMTLRQALDSLERRGLVLRVRGRTGGTFVADPKFEMDVNRLAGLTEQLRRQGHRAGARSSEGRSEASIRRRDSDVLQGVSLAVDWSQVVDLLGSGAIREAALRRTRAADRPPDRVGEVGLGAVRLAEDDAIAGLRPAGRDGRVARHDHEHELADDEWWLDAEA